MTESIINSLWRKYTDPHMVCPKLRFCSKEYKLRNATQEILEIISVAPNKTWETPTLRKNLKIMHISDLHPDLYYTVGAHTKCDEPVCCRANVSSTNMSFNERLRQHQEGIILTVDNNSS
jgi:hypothetical protein